MDRRSYLTQVAAIASLGLAGCSESGTPTRQPEQTPTPTTEPMETPTPTPTDEPMATASPTDSPAPTPTPTPRPEVAAEVVVGPDASFRFEPDTVEIAIGETVRWLWDSQGHNVRPGDVPSESDWSGTPGDDSDTYKSGYVYTHAFEVAGEYGYYCAPHRTSGMTGTVVVG